jgi:tetratricopeptide (TPR) repeat protein
LIVTEAWAGPSRRKPPPPPPAPEPAAAPGAPNNVDRAELLFRQGLSHFETSEYDEAVRLWNEAYSILDATPENRSIRNDLVYNIARAQVEAYRIDQDARRLRQAKQLLERYSQVYREISAGDEAALSELQRVDMRIEEIDKMIAQAERREADERERARREAASGPAAKQARALVISGAIGTGVGATGLGLAFAGLGIGVRADRDFENMPAERDDARRRGRQANVLVATGFAMGIAFLAAGITLLALGKRNQRRVRTSPTAGRGAFGLAVSGRF